MDHPIISDLKWRYAVKKYDPNRLLTAEQITVIREVLRLTPSSYGLQPYKFILVTDKELRRELATASHGQQVVADAPLLIVFCVNLRLNEQFVDGHIKNVSEVRGTPLENLDRYARHLNDKLSQMDDSEQLNWAAKQAYIALGQLIQTAAQLKVDATPLEGFEPEHYADILDLKTKGLYAVVACTLGFRSEEDNNQHLSKIRRPEDHLIIEM